MRAASRAMPARRALHAMVLLSASLVLGLGAHNALGGASLDWPQWRGAGGAGISTSTTAPLSWSSQENVAWRTGLPGRGHSSPVVAHGKVFLTAEVPGEVIPGAKAPKHKIEGEDFRHPESLGADVSHKLLVIALDAGTGAMLWQRTVYEGRMYDDRHRKGSYAAPTPVTDGKRVFAFFGGEGLYACNLDGKIVWSQSLGHLGSLGMGPGSSPILAGGNIVVQCDQETGEGSFIAGFDAASGKERWRTARKASASWATPLVAKIGGRDAVIASGNEQIAAYDARTGAEILSLPGLENNAIPSPVSGQGLAFLAAGYPKKHTLALRLQAPAHTDATNRIAWTYDKGAAYVPSPIYYEGSLYLMTDSGMLTCLDATSGKPRYEGERVPFPSKFTASPLALRGHLLLTSETGDTFVVKAGPKHEVVATNRVGEPVFASLAVAGDKIFLRGATNLFCIAAPKPKS